MPFHSEAPAGKSWLWILLGCWLTVSAFAGDYRFRVYLNDKGCDEQALSTPETFLSEAAVSRRARQHIRPDRSDLPISPVVLRELENQGFRIVVKSKWMQTVVVESPDSLAAVRRLAACPRVDSVRLVWKGDAAKVAVRKTVDTTRLAVSEDPVKDEYGYAADQIDLLRGKPLHRRGFRGEGVRIAVIDAGFTNADRIDAFDSVRIGGTYNVLEPGETVYGSDDHGTKVLSCLAASVPHTLIGTAPEATYWLLKSEDSRSEYPIEEDYWLAAAEYADSVGVDIITSSLGYYRYDDPAMNYRHADLDGKTALISRAASMASRKGILVFCSAGNEGNGSWEKITVPADADGVVTVGAVDRKKHRSVFSSSGYTADGRVKPDVVALGTESCVLNEDGELVFASGTSFATPILAGMAACLWQAFPGLSSRELAALLRQYASLAKKPTPELGYGIPDMYKLYKQENKHGPSNRAGS